MLALPLLVLVLAAPSQEQSRAEALLASSRPIDKAWGAYLAGRLNLTPLIPKLAAELDQLRPIPTTLDIENWSLAHALLDALIELNAPLSHEQLAPWLAGYSHPALILLIQNAVPNQQALLELRKSTKRRAHWLAITNLLVQQRTPGIVAALVSELRPVHVLSVQDSPGGGFGPGAGGGFGASCGTTQFAKEYPPAARYRIVDSDTAGDTLLVPGPNNIYYRRTTIPTNAQIGWDEGFQSLDTQEELIAYFAALTGLTRLETGLTFAGRSIIHWSTPQAFLVDAQAVLQRQAYAIRGMVRQFVQNQTLTAAELATLTVNIAPKNSDSRKDRAIPLPIVPPYPIDLTNP